MVIRQWLSKEQSKIGTVSFFLTHLQMLNHNNPQQLDVWLVGMKIPKHLLPLDGFGVTGHCAHQAGFHSPCLCSPEVLAQKQGPWIVSYL